MILIIDTETTGTDPKKDKLIEVAGAKYDEHYGLVACWSWLLIGKENAAEHVNHIAPQLLAQSFVTPYDVQSTVFSMTHDTRATVAHNASFDRQWLPMLEKPWVCSQRHIEWPSEQGRDVSLEKLALAHGVGVLPGHRAIYDVLTLVRVFDAVRVGNGGNRYPDAVPRLIDRALRPRAIYRADVSYQKNQLAKDAGFRWDADAKQWRKDMAVEDAPEFAGKVSFGIAKVEEVK